MTLGFDPQMTPRKQIRNLMMILVSGIACAFLLTLFMLYSYGPEGHYLLKNALLSPDVLSQLSLHEKNSKLGSPLQGVIDKIEFSNQDVETKKRTSLPVDQKTYAKFYNMIVDDKSLLDIPAEITAGFNQMPASSLVVMIHENNKTANNPNQVFQEIQFLYKGDYYRLQLRESSESNWIYFYHPHIYDDTLTLFTSAKL